MIKSLQKPIRDKCVAWSVQYENTPKKMAGDTATIYHKPQRMSQCHEVHLRMLRLDSTWWLSHLQACLYQNLQRQTVFTKVFAIINITVTPAGIFPLIPFFPPQSNPYTWLFSLKDSCEYEYHKE